MLTLDLIFLSPLPSSSYGRNFILCAATVVQEGHTLFPHIITCIKDIFLLVSKFRKTFFSGLINGSSMQPMAIQRGKDFHLMAYFWTLWNPWVRSLNKNPIFQMMMYSNKNANSRNPSRENNLDCILYEISCYRNKQQPGKTCNFLFLS